MLTHHEAILPTGNHPLWAVLAAFMLLLLVPPQAGAQTVDAPYASVDACASISQLEFNGTSANQSITEQVELGPRTTGSNGSAALRAMIHEQLPSWDVVNHTYTEGNFTFTNVVATYSSVAVNPLTPRVVLVAHYDSRDIAERDPDANRTGDPIPGANDGASGVAVLLELGRLIPMMNLTYEVEILFTDAEDQSHSSENQRLYGAEAWVDKQTEGDLNRTTAYIVVDMVGDAYLQLTHVYPGDLTLWSTISPLASALGLMENQQDCNGDFGRDIVNLSISTGVIDDHVPALNRGIRAIDLIDIRFGPDAEPFEGYWHTHEDTPDKVSAQSLADVGLLVELGLRSNAWIYDLPLQEETQGEGQEDSVALIEDEPAANVEVYVGLGIAALVGLLATITLLVVLGRSVNLHPPR
jgi:hypothetical protein